jgi:putative phage-type endonuclease
VSLATLVTDRDSWLAERRTGIGASEAAAAMGLSPYESPLGLYLRKTGAVPDAEETEAMRWGTRLEPLLAEAYRERTGKAILQSQVFLRDPDAPWRLATLDGIDSDGDLVEFKTTNAFAGRDLGEDDTDQLPDHWVIQAHQQMAVAGAERVRFGVLVGGQSFRTFTVERDGDLIAAVMAAVDGFWKRHVEKRVAPDPSAVDLAVLSRVRPTPGVEITLTGDGAFWAEQYAALQVEHKRTEAAIKTAKANILAAMGEAAVARTVDGHTFTRRVVEVGAKTIDAYSYVGLYHKGNKQR